jgi:hypothetical protein
MFFFNLKIYILKYNYNYLSDFICIEFPILYKQLIDIFILKLLYYDSYHLSI